MNYISDLKLAIRTEKLFSKNSIITKITIKLQGEEKYHFRSNYIRLFEKKVQKRQLGLL